MPTFLSFLQENSFAAPAGVTVLGAQLLLPDGASTWDLHRPQLFRDYALKHVHSWYQFVNDDLKCMAGSSGLYLVTGVTKSTSWSIDVKNFVDGLGNEASRAAGAAAYTPGWDDTSATINSGPHRSPGEESWPENQTVFIRGFKVALRASASTLGCDDIEDEELPVQSVSADSMAIGFN
jgi:hypothetical protein